MNWPRFLEQHGIHYVTSGPNTARDNISIQCPWCGPNDPSQHMGISLTGNGWGCWRNDKHRGNNPVRLIQALIKCSIEEAERIAGRTVTINVSDASFGTYINAIVCKTPRLVEQRVLELPSEIKSIYHDASWGYPIQYLQTRKYSQEEAVEVSRLYNLHYAILGPFKYRLIFPVYDQHDNLLTWTGRAMGRAVVRYKTLHYDEKKAKEAGLPRAIKPITDTLWNYHELAKCAFDKLIVVEGPFDAMRLDYIGRSNGIRSTCLFGKSVSEEQATLLGSLDFNILYLSLDPGVYCDAISIMQDLCHINGKLAQLPGQEDPADLPTNTARKWLNGLN